MFIHVDLEINFLGATRSKDTRHAEAVATLAISSTT